MKTKLPDAQLFPLPRKLLLQATVILVGIIGLIVFTPLAGCGSLGSVSDATTTTGHQSSSWQLAWSDEFDGAKGAAPDATKWKPEVGNGIDGWGNKQLEYDTNSQNAYQDGQGNLVLEARKENPASYQCWYGPCQYTSTRLSTNGHFSFTYGRLEARIKVPRGQGIWSGFWLLGANCETVGWPTCGEIDVMENISKEPSTIHGSVHGPGALSGQGYFSGSYTLSQGAFADNFHIYVMEWDANRISFFVDGNNYATLNKTSLTNQHDWVYDHPFDIILHLPVGGVWPGDPDSTTTFPQRMYISYIRLYTNG
jgi:beta-glucanase (GH16 family)